VTSAGRLPRTIRLDASDTVVFATAAVPGEWAVSGTFLFAGRDPERFARKERIAFRTGFLGLASFGFSTLVVVSEADAAERAAAAETLARQLVARLGAPDMTTARDAAQEELAFAAELCADHAVGTLVALHRTIDADGALRERFRTLRPRESTSLGAGHLRGHDKAFFVVETDEDEPEAPVDLAGLMKGAGR
jgi:hypothetical protein